MNENKLKPKSPNSNPTQLDAFLDPEGQHDPFEPKNWAQNWVEPKKRVGFGRTNVPDLV